jgi:hypothetical protein
METNKLRKICEQVMFDVKNDAKEFDGRSFDGKTVATYFGYHGAAIGALAEVVASLVVKIDELEKRLSAVPEE